MRYDDDPVLDVETLDLHLTQVANRIALGENELRLQHLELQQFMVDAVIPRLVVGLTGYVLTEHDGEPVTDEQTRTRTTRWEHSYKVRPWWIPKWLWARCPDEPIEVVATATATARASVQPAWTYPHATVAAELGRPYQVRFIR